MRSWLELLVADARRDRDADVVLVSWKYAVEVGQLLEKCRRIVLRRVEHRAVRGIPASREQAGAFVVVDRSEEHTSELQSLMRISYAVFCLKKQNKDRQNHD